MHELVLMRHPKASDSIRRKRMSNSMKKKKEA